MKQLQQLEQTAWALTLLFKQKQNLPVVQALLREKRLQKYLFYAKIHGADYLYQHRANFGYLTHYLLETDLQDYPDIVDKLYQLSDMAKQLVITSCVNCRR